MDVYICQEDALPGEAYLLQERIDKLVLLAYLRKEVLPFTNGQE